jgi:hypothetical protein
VKRVLQALHDGELADIRSNPSNFAILTELNSLHLIRIPTVPQAVAARRTEDPEAVISVTLTA